MKHKNTPLHWFDNYQFGKFFMCATPPVDTPNALSLKPLSVCIAIALSCLTPTQVVAQTVVADPNAPKSQKPVILPANTTHKTVPLVQIASPVNGISHNRYHQFDIGQAGLILNNSRTGAHTVLAGQIDANPFLQKGEAYTILNEVNGPNISHLAGNLEIAGQKANVVIANPSGIVVNGLGFINAHEATLSTGRVTPIAYGLVNHEVAQGAIDVIGTLGSQDPNLSADYLTLYAKAIEASATLHANEQIQLTAGKTKDGDNGSSATTNPQFAIDIKALGGMHANSIRLIGTGLGVGVRQSGKIHGNELIINANGKIVHTGKTNAGYVDIQGANVELSDTALTASDTLSLTAKQNITSTNSQLSSEHAVALTAGQNLELNNTTINAKEDIKAIALLGHVRQNSSHLISGGDIVGYAGGEQHLTNSRLNGKNTIQLQGQSALTLQDSHLAAQKHLALYSNNQQTLQNSHLQSQGILSTVSQGNLTTKGQVSYQGGAILVEANKLLVEDASQLTLNTTKSSALTGDLSALNGDISLQTTEDLSLKQNVAASAIGDISLRSGQGMLSLQGEAGTKGNGSEKNLRLTSQEGGIVLQGNGLTLEGVELTAKDDINLYATKGHIVVGGMQNTLTNLANKNTYLLLNKQLSAAKKERQAFLASTNYQAYLQDKNALDALIAKASQLAFKPAPKDDLEPTLGSPISPVADDCVRSPVCSRHYPPDGVRPPAFRSASVLPGSLTSSAPKAVPTLPADMPKIVEYLSVQDQEVAIALHKRLTTTHAKVIKQDKQLTETEDRLASKLAFVAQNNTGYEYSGSTLTSKAGSIGLHANEGIGITGTTLHAKQDIGLTAHGQLGTYMPTASPTPNETNQLVASILLDSGQNYYETLADNGNHHRMLSFATKSAFIAGNNITLKATNTQKNTQDNTHLVLQGASLTAGNALGVHSNHHLLLDVSHDHEYSFDKTRTKHGKWYKRKYTESETTNEWIDINPNTLTANTITLQTHGTPNNSHLTVYGADMNAKNALRLTSTGHINLYATHSSHKNIHNSQTKSRLLGIKYKSSKTNATRLTIQALPTALKASYINTQSTGDTTLEGTEFNYLTHATIQAGGKINLLPAVSTLDEVQNTQSASIVWQRMDNEGQNKEEAVLPSFTGISKPAFIAEGGLAVQVPQTEQDAQKRALRTQILALSENPEYAYLAELVNRQDVDWQTLLLSQKEWHHSEQGLTPAGAAILTVALAIATGPGGLGIGTGTATTMTGTLSNAALSTLVNQATISLINNGGNIKKTLKELGSKQNVKGLVFAIASAGVASKLDGTLLKNIDLSDKASFNHRLVKNIAHSTSNALLESAVYGTSLEDALEKNLKLALVDTTTSEVFQSWVKPIDKEGGIDALAKNLAHKIAAGLTGCLSAHLSSQDCEAGALGAVVGELWGDYRNNYLNTSDEQVKQQLINEAKLIAAITAALAEQDPATAAKMAGEAVRWNALQPQEWMSFAHEIQQGCYTQINAIDCQLSIQKWKDKSYKDANLYTQEDRDRWEEYVLSTYSKSFELCGSNQLCNYHVSKNMLASMIKFAGRKNSVREEAYSTEISVNIFLNNKSNLTLMAVNDFGWMLEVGAFSNFGNKTIQFLNPIFSRNKVVIHSLSDVPREIDASKLRYAMPSSWFKASQQPTTNPISIAVAEIKTSSGNIERLVAVSGNAWHGENAPKVIFWQGYNYKVIFNDLKKLPNRGNENHAEKRIFEYINSAYNNQRVNVKIAVENTSAKSVGMCTGCTTSIQDLSRQQPKLRITMFHGSTKTNP